MNIDAPWSRWIAVASLALAGCASTPQAPAPDAASRFVPSQHAGIWASHGYGWVMAIDGSDTRLIHAAGDVCVQDPQMQDSIVPLLDRVRVEDEGATLVVWSDVDTYPYRFSRLAALPAACAHL